MGGEKDFQFVCFTMYDDVFVYYLFEFVGIHFVSIVQKWLRDDVVVQRGRFLASISLIVSSSYIKFLLPLLRWSIWMILPFVNQSPYRWLLLPSLKPRSPPSIPAHPRAATTHARMHAHNSDNQVSQLRWWVPGIQHRSGRRQGRLPPSGGCPELCRRVPHQGDRVGRSQWPEIRYLVRSTAVFVPQVWEWTDAFHRSHQGGFRRLEGGLWIGVETDTNITMDDDWRGWWWGVDGGGRDAKHGLLIEITWWVVLWCVCIDTDCSKQHKSEDSGYCCPIGRPGRGEQSKRNFSEMAWNYQKKTWMKAEGRDILWAACFCICQLNFPRLGRITLCFMVDWRYCQLFVMLLWDDGHGKWVCDRLFVGAVNR